MLYWEISYCLVTNSGMNIDSEVKWFLKHLLKSKVAEGPEKGH